MRSTRTETGRGWPRSTPASRARSSEAAERGARLELLPCGTSAADVLAREPDAVFLANGPGDPAALDHVVATVRELVGKVPVFGICLGHQLLCRAVGLETFKLPFGHRGANHPVKDLETGQDRDHRAEPRLRGARARAASSTSGRRAGALGDGLRRGRAVAPEPLRPHRRGADAAGRPRRMRPVPPGSRPRPPRLALSVRQVPGDGEIEPQPEAWVCMPRAPTSTRS